MTQILNILLIGRKYIEYLEDKQLETGDPIRFIEDEVSHKCFSANNF